jgi:hypothetical protein
MKKLKWAGPLAAIAAVAVGTAYAVDLHTPHLGSSCPAGFVGNYHFVNNQIPEGTGTGTLWASWNSGDTCQVDAYKVNLHTQHFRCEGMLGVLTAASTNLPGKLVLSDYTCTRIKKCDPKYDPKCEVL